jgi:hypothetical protein
MGFKDIRKRTIIITGLALPNENFPGLQGGVKRNGR